MLADSELDAFVIATAESLRAELQSLADSAGVPCEPSDHAVSKALDRCLAHLKSTGVEGPANRLPSSRLWAVAQRLLVQGSLQTHARQKPLGYAGDYSLLDRICRGDVRGTGIGASLDRYFQRQAAPEAVRNRSRAVAARIAARLTGDGGRTSAAISPFRLASVGSGPAWDIRWALESVDPSRRMNVDVILIDLDPHALEFCRQSLETLIDVKQLTLIRTNLMRLPRSQATLAKFAECDLICCPGFFDYLDDTDAVMMLRSLWDCVGPAGELIAFNFAEGHASRPYMEWFGNWYLKYRTRESMRQLAESAALSASQYEVAVEPAGVNLYWHFRRVENS